MERHGRRKPNSDLLVREPYPNRSWNFLEELKWAILLHTLIELTIVYSLRSPLAMSYGRGLFAIRKNEDGSCCP
ncbi:hypothetical protein GOP47_0030141 [Adiantum capillus-veneris]|nr:hypothetical protein GOP47_0030141 [Adiantum capillus-veneris]